MTVTNNKPELKQYDAFIVSQNFWAQTEHNGTCERACHFAAAPSVF